MGVVVFDAAEFLTSYPNFSTLTTGQLTNAFSTACLYLDNTDGSISPYDPDNGEIERKTLLYLLTAHVSQSLQWAAKGVSSPLSSASQGSVSSSFATAVPGTKSWFMLTGYGQQYWQATRKYVVGGRYHVQRYYHPWG
ncbi:DUF4054 domain-containing protein [Dickeya poaceiphila]|uniref:DUF4054 domain-containing protein n=1 Tax=Dickeya poaceiphila TaxID=568768 RepID=A0A5B8I4N1_9GAMM|nr:DUF4054 domain-containing protein [Dickeya poaceiphila]QDX29551.1 DUF4054 domain-containing protein [Dickeya poaceiphila]